MKKILPFGTPLFGQNPDDALFMSIVDAYDKYELLINSFSYTAATKFIDKGRVFYDAHVKADIPFIHEMKQKYMEIKPKDIITFIENTINDGKYILMDLDWVKIAYLQMDEFTYIPHPVSIWGIDSTQSIMYLADFIDDQKYTVFKATYQEVENAYSSVLEKMNKQFNQSLSIAIYEVFPFDNNGEVSKWINQIEEFLNAEQIWDESMFKSTAITKVSDGGEYYSAPILRKDFGIDVLKGIVEHLESCIADEEVYIYEKKNMYLLYLLSLILVKKVEIVVKMGEMNTIKEELREIESQSIQLSQLAKRIHLINIKYLVVGDKTILTILLKKVKEWLPMYVSILKKIQIIFSCFSK